ncbi:MAG: chromate efflux transporter [Microcoleaceae cyanobacterium]
MHPQSSEQSLNLRLKELAQVFLKLGTIGFGGPQAHIAMQNDEAVIRRQWLTAEQFTEGLAICEMLPGPASTQLGIYLGYIRAGQLGAFVAGLCFITPAFLIVLALSWGYFRFQGLPQVEALFLGISPVVSAIILAFCWRLGRKTLKDWQRSGITLVVFGLTLLSPLSIFLQFIGAGLVGILLYQSKSESTPKQLKARWFLPLPLTLGTLTPETLTLSSFWGWERIGEYFWPLLLFFFKVGSFIFGGGLVIIPLLESEVVERLGWLTRTEFINGVAIGQLSPGPVVLTAAFVGYKVAGVVGALVSTVGIFTPSFAFIMLAAPLLLKLRQNPWIKAFLQGVTPAVLGAIAAAAIPLLESAIIQDNLIDSIIAGVIGLLAFIALIRYKTPTWLLVPLGAVLGLSATFIKP